MFNRFSQFKALLTLREAFVAILPIVLVMSLVAMLSGCIALLPNAWINPTLTGFREQGASISRLYYFLLPLFVSVSLTTLLAKQKELEHTSTLLVVMVCFFRLSGFLSVNPSAQVVSYHSSVLTSIPLTWLAVWCLHGFSQQPRLQLVTRSPEISPRLTRALNSLIPALLTILCCELIRYSITYLMGIPAVQLLLSYNSPLTSPFQAIPELILYKSVSLSAWMIGLHGDHSASSFFRFLYNTPIGEQNVIQLKTFHAVFMNMGGAGATLPIPFIILFSKRISQFKTIAKLSLPFSLFNVNEILVFGLPIILNPIFIIPFFSVAFVNMAIALFAIHLGLFSIHPEPIYWMFPVFLKGYFASDKSMWALLTQLICIVIDGCIYYPFLLTASRQYESPGALARLLTESHRSFVVEALDQQQEPTYLRNQQRLLKENQASQKILDQLKQGHFLLYFQPKVEVRSRKIVGLEALLRFQDKQGIIHPPTFLPLLYQQGLSKAIDEKVVNMVFEQLWKWRSQRIAVPTIAINFDIAFLLDAQAVRAFLKRAKSSQVRFCIEITEHTYVTELAALASVIRKIRSAGHHISIDDFGTGYSSLTSLVSLEVDEIKLDRALVVPPKIESERSEMMLTSIIQLCHNLGFSVVAEGVETAARFQKIQQYGADVIQGYYFGRPVSAHKISQTLLASNRPKAPVR